MTLNDIKPGERCVILALGRKNALRKRIIDMGMTIGTEIRVNKLAPLGDPMEVTVRGYQLSLRRTEAEQIFVRRV